MKQIFSAKIIQAEGRKATGIPVPVEVVEALNGGKRPTVKVQLNDYTFTIKLGGYGDQVMIPFSSDHRDASGLQANDDVTVTLELDTAPRTVDVPDYLVIALEEHALKETFDALAYSKRKEYVRQVESAKTVETRLRRLDKIIAELS